MRRVAPKSDLSWDGRRKLGSEHHNKPSFFFTFVPPRTLLLIAAVMTSRVKHRRAMCFSFRCSTAVSLIKIQPYCATTLPRSRNLARQKTLYRKLVLSAWAPTNVSSGKRNLRRQTIQLMKRGGVTRLVVVSFLTRIDGDENAERTHAHRP